VNRFGITTDIPAAPDRVWAILADVERWPEWTPSVTRITRLDAGPLVVGSRARIHQPRLLPATWRIVELAEGRRFTWVTGGPGIRAVAEHSVEPVTRGSRVTLSVRFEGLLASLVARLTRDLNRRYLELEAAGLRERSLSPGKQPS
jgi:carbon monoxide dehydrogenase subunit G